MNARNTWEEYNASSEFKGFGILEAALQEQYGKNILFAVIVNENNITIYYRTLR